MASEARRRGREAQRNAAERNVRSVITPRTLRTSVCHHILKKDGHRFLLSVPVHGKKILKSGTLRGLINASDISVERFVELLDD